MDEGNWSNEHFWIKSEVVDGVISQYISQYIPVVSGEVETSASSLITHNGAHTVGVSTSNSIQTNVQNKTSFWLKAADANDIQVTFHEPLAFANGHPVQLAHIVCGADPSLTESSCDCYVFQNMNTGMKLGAIGNYNPATRELALMEVHTDINTLWKSFCNHWYRVMADAEKKHVKTLNMSLSPAQKAADWGFGLSVLLALGGWFLSPLLGAAGIVGAVATFMMSRAMGAKMPAMQSWIASKVAVTAPLQRILESAYAGELRKAPLRSA